MKLKSIEINGSKIELIKNDGKYQVKTNGATIHCMTEVQALEVFDLMTGV